MKLFIALAVMCFSLNAMACLGSPVQCQNACAQSPGGCQ